MESITTKVNQLSREVAIEAAKIVAGNLVDEPGLTENEFRHQFGEPMSHLSDMDTFARILLINAWEKPEYRPLVEQAIDNSGKKQLVLGGTEIIALAILGVAALRMIINPVSEEEFEYTKKDGTKMKHKKKHNSSTDFLTQLLSKYFDNKN